MTAPKIRPLSEIKAKLLRPATTSHFECYFQPKKPITDFISTRSNGPLNLDLINISCCDASLPGSSLQTATLTDSYTGVTENYAYRRAYDNRADFTFYVDYMGFGSNTPYSVILFFENWISYIVGEDSRSGQSLPNYFYRVRFPNEYVADKLTINKFEKDLEKTGRYLQYNFIRAFPISIASIPVTYESSQVLKCTVSFSYQRYILSTERGSVTSSSRPAPGTPISRPSQPNNPTPGSGIVAT